MQSTNGYEIQARSIIKLGDAYAVSLPRKLVDELEISDSDRRKKNIVVVWKVNDGIATILLKKLDVAEIMEAYFNNKLTSSSVQPSSINTLISALTKPYSLSLSE